MMRIDRNGLRQGRSALPGWLVALALCAGPALALAAGPAPAPDTRASDPAALFDEIAPVLRHPRCLNCHSGQSFPRQGDGGAAHRFNVQRGGADRGAAGLHCAACHQSSNQTSGIPGAPGWHLAPAAMGWVGLSNDAICRALSDPARGNMTAAELAEHLRTDPLVRWAFAPGSDIRGRARGRPPLDHAAFLTLIERWRDNGAPCPD